MLAFRVSIDDLKPHEYDEMSAWRYDEIAYARECYRSAQRLYPPGWDDHKPERR